MFHCVVKCCILLCDTEVNIFVLHTTQLLAQLVSCDWWVVTFLMRAEWRSVWTMSGALCVMTLGALMMLLWCVGSWDTLLKVSRSKCNFIAWEFKWTAKMIRKGPPMKKPHQSDFKKITRNVGSITITTAKPHQCDLTIAPYPNYPKLHTYK